MLAGSHKWKVYPTGKTAQPIHELGEIILLPKVEGVDSERLINTLLEDILGERRLIKAPEWAEKITPPSLEKINFEISKKLTEIEKENQILNELNLRKNELESYKKLLYADGKELEEIFEKCLHELGGQVLPAKHAEEEYCLVYKNYEVPVEAKGNSKSISMTDLRQLFDYLAKYDDYNGKANKGILLGNAWKNLPLEKRDTTEKPIFPSNVIERAKGMNIALVSSMDFFWAFSKFLEDNSLGIIILDRIVGSAGVVNFKNLNK